jgi:SPP1 gp7 family putative phage head morphogenesis protein
VQWQWPWFKTDPTENIYRAVANHRRDLLASEKTAVQRMARTWAAVHQETTDRLEDLTRRMAQAEASGVEIGRSWLYQQERYQNLLTTIERNMSAYARTATEVIAAQQSASASLGVIHGQKLMGLVVQGDFRRVPVEAVRNIVGAFRDGSPLSSLFEKIGPGMAARAQEVFAEGVAAGINPRTIARRLEGEIKDIESRSLVIARTESIRAYRIGQLDNYRANDDIIAGWIWSSARDKRTCPICLAMDGTRHSLDEEMGTHPACRCGQVPFTKYRTANRGTGEDYLRTLPEAEQREILGPTRFQMWSDGKPLREFVHSVPNEKWGPSQRLIPLRDMQGAPKPASRPKVPTPTASPAKINTPPLNVKDGAKQTVTVVKNKKSVPADLSGRQLSVAHMNKALEKDLRAALALIDGVHGPDGATRWGVPLPITRANKKNAHGYFGRSFRRGVGYTPNQIGICTDQHPRLTLVHEMGHYFDFSMEGTGPVGGIEFASNMPRGMSPERKALWNEFIDACADTDELRYVKANLRGKLRDYYVSPEEMFARAYSQYIAVKSKDPTLLAEIESVRTHPVAFFTQWTDQAFGPIESALDAILKSYQMIK